MFLLYARKDSKQSTICVVVPNKEAVLLAFKPSLLSRENTCLCKRIDFKLQVILCRHVARQFFRFISQNFQRLFFCAV